MPTTKPPQPVVIVSLPGYDWAMLPYDPATSAWIRSNGPNQHHLSLLHSSALHRLRCLCETDTCRWRRSHQRKIDFPCHLKNIWEIWMSYCQFARWIYHNCATNNRRELRHRVCVATANRNRFFSGQYHSFKFSRTSIFMASSVTDRESYRHDRGKCVFRYALEKQANEQAAPPAILTLTVGGMTSHHLLVYLEDCVVKLLEHREQNVKVNPVKFLSEYFSSVRDGKHVMFREYKFLQATPLNRSSFIRLFWKSFIHLGKHDLLSVAEYHSLLSLICPDFPYEPVQRTARIILMDDALDCLIAFPDFLYAFQVQLYYQEFLDKCSELFKHLVANNSSQADAVIVPTSTSDEEPSQSAAKGDKSNNKTVSENLNLNKKVSSTIAENNKMIGDKSVVESVEAGQFLRALFSICDRHEYSSPPVGILKDIVIATPRISFYGFLTAVVKSEEINQAIGLLPEKASLLDAVIEPLPQDHFKDMTNGNKLIFEQENRSEKQEKPCKLVTDAVEEKKTMPSLDSTANKSIPLTRSGRSSAPPSINASSRASNMATTVNTLSKSYVVPASVFPVWRSHSATSSTALTSPAVWRSNLAVSRKNSKPSRRKKSSQTEPITRSAGNACVPIPRSRAMTHSRVERSLSMEHQSDSEVSSLSRSSDSNTDDDNDSSTESTT